jgi:acyl-CoA thioester hydrolase
MSDGHATELEIRIDWSELDLLGHVNNLAIQKYIQASRVQFLEEIGMMKLHAETGIGPILASTSCQFLKQLRYPGTVRARTWVEGVKHTSFTLKASVLDETGDAVAEALDVVVVYDFANRHKQPIPDDVRRALLSP